LIATKKKAGNGFNSNAHVNEAYCSDPGKQEIEMKCGNQAFSTGSVPDWGQHNFTAANDLLAASIDPGLVLKFPNPQAGKSSGDVASPIYQTLESKVHAPIYQPINSGVDAPIYQPINSGVNAPIYQPINSGADAPIYQPINSGADAPIYQPINSGVDAPIYQPINSGFNAPLYQPIGSGPDVPVYQPLSSNQKSPKVGAEKTSQGNAANVCQSPNYGVTSPIYQALNNIPKFSKA